MTIKNISFNELKKLLDKNNLTTDERYLIDSYVHISLVDYCGNLNLYDKEKVQYLEEENLYRYLHAASTALGLYGNALEELLTHVPFSSLAFGFKNRYSGSRLERKAIELFIKMMLSCNSKADLNTPYFEGEMPQKFMSFRNQTAQEWFKEFVNINILILITVYEKMTIEDARVHLLASVAYQLHHNNPVKYAISSNMSIDEALKSILKKFINEKGKNGAYVYSSTGELLSKML